jgi:hypothetical protein
MQLSFDVSVLSCNDPTIYYIKFTLITDLLNGLRNLTVLAAKFQRIKNKDEIFDHYGS